jgi:transcriptional regulator with XRE-family HTH domain
LEYDIVKLLVAAVDARPEGLIPFARRAGVSFQMLYQWRTGTTRRPRIDTLMKVAEALGYSIDLSAARPRLVALRPVRTPWVDQQGRPHKTAPQEGLSGPRMRMLLRSLQ